MGTFLQKICKNFLKKWPRQKEHGIGTAGRIVLAVLKKPDYIDPSS
jgi:hypothetical protein